MTSQRYSEMSDERLAEAFVKLSIDEADAIGLGNVHAVNNLFNQLRAIERALRARGPQARKVLAPLLKYSAAPPPFSQDRAAQVRLNAARELLAVVPEEARSTLEDLAAHGPSDQSGRAGMCLQFLQDGVFKPM